MTNLRCTADHHAVPPLNIRPVYSGIILDHFSTGWKTDPAHTNPRCILDQNTLDLPDQGPRITDPSIFTERERAGLIDSLVWTGLKARLLICKVGLKEKKLCARDSRKEKSTYEIKKSRAHEIIEKKDLRK